MNNINKIYDDFYNDYRERYNVYWVRKFGMIPHLPSSLDNSNSIYELLAWLQRAFKGLLDDFINQQLEFEQFKNAITLLLEKMIPELIRQYVQSDEFRNVILKIINDWYEKELKPIIDDLENRVSENEENIKNLENSISNINNRLADLTEFENRLSKVENDVKNLNKIIDKLSEIGVWDKEKNDFKDGMGIAGGNINLFGNVQDGKHYIRTNNKKTENDLVGGV